MEKAYILWARPKGSKKRKQRIKLVFESDKERLSSAKVYISQKGSQIITYVDLDFKEA